MICDNCGAETDKKERYCPNCGMEFPGPRPKPSKKKYYKNSRESTRDNPRSRENYGNNHYEDNSRSKGNYMNYQSKEDFERKPLKRRDYDDSKDFTYDIPHPKADYRNYNEKEDYERKPLKRKYYGNSLASARPNPYYQDEEDYESYYTDEEDYKTKKSGSSLGTMLLLLVIVLLFGFIIGLIMFSSPQSTPTIPGLSG